jgi:hypothetical protein
MRAGWPQRSAGQHVSSSRTSWCAPVCYFWSSRSRCFPLLGAPAYCVLSPLPAAAAATALPAFAAAAAAVRSAAAAWGRQRRRRGWAVAVQQQQQQLEVLLVLSLIVVGWWAALNCTGSRAYHCLCTYAITISRCQSSTASLCSGWCWLINQLLLEHPGATGLLCCASRLICV